MQHEIIKLPDTGVTLTTYLTDNDAVEPGRKRPLVLIFPGGAYYFRSPREAEPVALRLLGCGIQAAVVGYSVAPARWPTALNEAAEAVAFARNHAAEWHCDAGKIAVMGFSAGGHAAGSAGIFWEMAGRGRISRPDAMILAYPVVTSGKFAHRDSFRNLLGEAHDELAESVSLEKYVSTDTPPAFLWHTWEDELVPVENSLLLASALRRRGVPCEMHIWQRGIHGLSLSDEEVYEQGSAAIQPDCQGWLSMAARWLKAL